MRPDLLNTGKTREVGRDKSWRNVRFFISIGDFVVETSFNVVFKARIALDISRGSVVLIRGSLPHPSDPWWS